MVKLTDLDRQQGEDEKRWCSECNGEGITDRVPCQPCLGTGLAAIAEVIAERDRLRAVADGLREWQQAEAEQRQEDAQRLCRDTLAALDQLDGSGVMGDEPSTDWQAEATRWMKRATYLEGRLRVHGEVACSVCLDARYSAVEPEPHDCPAGADTAEDMGGPSDEDIQEESNCTPGVMAMQYRAIAALDADPCVRCVYDHPPGSPCPQPETIERCPHCGAGPEGNEDCPLCRALDDRSYGVPQVAEDPPAPATLAWAAHYFSTYCIHEDHERCRLTCKTCGAPCRCGCHGGGEESHDD